MEYKDKSAAQKSIDVLRNEIKLIDDNIQGLKNKRDGLWRAIDIIETVIAKEVQGQGKKS